MTCAHVLGLIDAAPFANYPAAHVDAAWDHARGCATCGPALNAATALATDLSRLPQPETPPQLAAAVLARIARLDLPERSRPATLTAPTKASQVYRWQDRVAALAGVVASSLVVLSLALGDGPALDLTSPRIGGVSGLFAAASTSTSWAVLAVSLVVYLIALLVPLRVVEPRRQ
jgi:hypothetical protein